MAKPKVERGWMIYNPKECPYCRKIVASATKKGVKK